MSKIISFLNRKGGTGKTTNAVNVAKEIRRLGFSITLIETDRNYSLNALRATESFSPKIDGIGIKYATELNAIRVLKSMKALGPDFIIVDGAAEMKPDILAGIAAISDLTIIPTNTNPVEVDTTRQTLRDIAEAVWTNAKVKVALLPSRIHWLTEQTTVERALALLKTPVLPYVPNYKDLTYMNTHRPVQLYKAITKHILNALTDPRFIFQPDKDALKACYDFSNENRNTPDEAHHYTKCEYSKCDKGNPPGYFYNKSAKGRFCCDTHRVMASRERAKTIPA